MPPTPRYAVCHGLTFVELLVLIALSAVLLGGCIRVCHGLDQADARDKCADNLKQIGQAILQYARDHRGSFPRTVYKYGDTVIPDVTNGGYDSPDPFAADTKVPANCVPAAMFLILRTEQVSPAVFNCPATQAQPDDFGGNGNTVATRSNFSDLSKNLSYSYADPYPDARGVGAGYKMVAGMDPAFAAMADLNPGGDAVLSAASNMTADQLRAANSPNHNQDGQNVLYADGSVQFQTTCLCGVNGDNIYKRGDGPSTDKSDLANSPVNYNDSFLLPIAPR